MPRGERGGKKTQASKDRAKEVAQGLRNPRQNPTGASGLERVRQIESQVALAEARPKDPPTKRLKTPGHIPEVSAQNAPSSSSSVPKSTGRVPVEDAEKEVSGKEVVVASEIDIERVIPKAPPARASEPVGTVSLRPSFGREVAGPSAPLGGEDLKIRLSVDLHGVLDLDSHEDGVFNVESRGALCGWLHSNKRFHQAGVCSYIGHSGPKSQERRVQAKREVNRFNDDFHCDLRLLLTSDKKKSALDPSEVSCHIDDRLDLAYSLRDRGVPVILVNSPKSSPIGIPVC